MQGPTKLPPWRMQPSAAPTSVEWRRLSDMSHDARELLQGAGITAAVAKRLVEELGFTSVGDAQVCTRMRSMFQVKCRLRFGSQLAL